MKGKINFKKENYEMIFTRTITKESRINKAGIYLIRSRTNGKEYVGSSVNIIWRVFGEHYPELVKGKHYNILLQNHCRKYGIDDLCFGIVEFCPREKKGLWYFVPRTGSGIPRGFSIPKGKKIRIF